MTTQTMAVGDHSFSGHVEISLIYTFTIVNRYSEKLPALQGGTDVDVESLEVSPGMRFGRQKRTADDMTDQDRYSTLDTVNQSL